MPIGIRLLGGVRLYSAGRDLPLPAGERLRVLLANLVLDAGRSVPRAVLAARIWPGSARSQARTNLRHELHRLARASPQIAARIRRTDDALSWLADPADDCDVIAFETAAAAASAASSVASDRHWAVCADRYAGPFMPGIGHAWAVRRREALASQFRRALTELASVAERLESPADVIVHATRLIDEDPCDEGATLALMRAHLARGDAVAALRVYRHCVQRLSAELGASPSLTLRALGESIGATREMPLAIVNGRRRDWPAACHGRDDEQQRLLGWWCAVGRLGLTAVVIEGEPGIGKSRLAQWLADEVAGQGAEVRVAEAHPSGHARAFAALEGWIGDIARGSAARSDHDRVALFERMVAAISDCPAPRLLVFEDLQWADADTLDFIRELILRRLPTPLLIVATRRTGEESPESHLDTVLSELSAEGAIAPLRLLGLSEAAVDALADSVLSRPGLDRARMVVTPALRDQIRQLANGNPLHVLEWARLASEAPEVLSTAVPARIEAAVERRLRRLSANERRVLNLIALAGTRLSPALLCTASRLDEDGLLASLEVLIERKLIDDEGAGPLLVHETIRRVVAASIRPVRRRQIHGRLAATLERQPANELEAAAAQIAGQWSLAGEPARAGHWYGRAAAFAESCLAPREAIRMLEHALRMLAILAPGPAQRVRQAKLLLGIAGNAQVVEGFASPILLSACERLESLLGQIDELETRAQILNRLRMRHSSGDGLPVALGFARESALVSRHIDIPLFRIEAERALGQTLFAMGCFREAELRYRRAARSLARAIDHGSIDPGRPTWSVHQLYAGWALAQWRLGDPASAQANLMRARSLRALDRDPLSRANAGRLRAILFACLGDIGGVEQELRWLSAAVADDRSLMIADLEAHRGWLNLACGAIPEALVNLRRGVRSVLRDDGGWFETYWYGCLARAYLAADRPARALAVLRVASSRVGRSRQAGFQAEILRLRAAALAALGADDRVIRQALETARACASRQGADRLAQWAMADRPIQLADVTDVPRSPQ
ncbi:MAG: BTAD domain-containing putative transcriptional regulator [Burkholderiaceae bacterium]